MPKPTSSIPGRSWLRGEVTLEEIRRLTAPFGPHGEALFADEMMQGREYDVLVVDGPLKLKGDFDSFAHKLVGLVVRGDLSVGGLYRETDDPATGVFVLGDMHAGRVITTGQLCVKGSLTVDGPLVGFYNDYSAEIGRDVRAACFFPENHFFRIGGRLTAGVVLGDAAKYRVPDKLRASLSSLDPEEYRAVLVPEVLEPREDDGGEAELDYDAFKARVRAGQSVLRKGGKSSPAGKAEPRKMKVVGNYKSSEPATKSEPRKMKVVGNYKSSAPAKKPKSASKRRTKR